MKKDNLTDSEIDSLYTYYQEEFGVFSDDVDAENARCDRWIEGLSEEEIKEILETPSEKLARLASELKEGMIKIPGTK